METGAPRPLSGIVQISSGYMHVCALKSSGEVLCWGQGNNGQLGNDGTTDNDAPVSVVDGDGSSTALSGIVQIASGELHTCALKSNAEVLCWGKGQYGRLGNNATDNKDHPVSVVVSDGSTTPLSNIVQISSGFSHTCALKSSGEGFCWGRGQKGRLGNDGIADKSYPVSVVDGDGSTTPLSGIVQISSGGAHTCAVMVDGGVKCWGNGQYGQLGNDATGDNDAPVAVVDGDGSSTLLSGIVEVTSAHKHSCGLKSNGEIYCWGEGVNGKLGNDATDNKDHPVKVYVHDGSATDTFTPGTVARIPNVLSAGGSHTCAMIDDGTLKCWGKGANGRLGNNATADTDAPDTVDSGDGVTTALSGIVQISSWGSHTCALKSDGGVVCWGEGGNGRLGNDGTVNKDHPVTVVDGDGSSTALSDIVQIAVGGYHTCALKSDGKVLCWGGNMAGQLGNNGTTDTDAPDTVDSGDNVTSPLTGIVQIVLGEYHTCALKSDGKVLCWGSGSYGRLGNDGTANKDHPVSVVDGDGSTTPLSGVVQIVAGVSHTCALKSSGEVLCWGWGSDGRLGNDNTANKDHPVTVVDGDGSSTALSDIVRIAAGGSHTCALKSSGGSPLLGVGEATDGLATTTRPIKIIPSP